MIPAPRLLKFAGLALVGATLGFWAAKGAHLGWSQNRVPVAKTDEITGIVFTTYEERFVPGVEFLGTGLILGAVCLGIAFFLRQKKPTASNS